METWRKNLYVLWGSQFLAMIGMNLVVPFLPFFIRELGVTDNDEVARWSGIAFAGPFMTSFIATPLWGAMGDRHGRKLMVVRAIFGLGLSQVLVGFSQNVYQLLLFRLVQGAISGFIAAALALVSSSTPKEKIGYALGFLQSATAGGTVLGPAVGGILADTIGYRYIFFIVAALCFLGGILIMKLVTESPVTPYGSQPASVIDNFRYMFSNRQLRIVALAIVVGQGAALMIEPLFALYIEGFQSGGRYLATLTGIMVAVSGIFMVVSSPWWGRRNDRLGFKSNLVLAFIGTGTAYSLHMVVPDIFSAGILRAGLGFVRGGILHTLYSITSLESPAHRQSGLMGVASSLTVLGNMTGPLAGGMIAGFAGLKGVFIGNSILFLAGGILIMKFLGETGRGEPARQDVSGDR